MQDPDPGLTPAPAVDETYGPPAAAQRTSGKAIGAMVCGIISLLIGVFGIILGIVAVFLGITARKEIATSPGVAGGGMALAGIICGAIGIAIGLIIILLIGSLSVAG